MILEIKNLSFAYDKYTVFKDLNFKLESPNVLSILGPNGIGKTTLIKCLLGIKKKTSGEILHSLLILSRVEKKLLYIQF